MQYHQVPSQPLEESCKYMGTQENGFMGRASDRGGRRNNYILSSVGTKMLSFCFTREMKGKKHQKHQGQRQTKALLDSNLNLIPALSAALNKPFML